jgi:hypothetical protein
MRRRRGLLAQSERFEGSQWEIVFQGSRVARFLDLK